MLLQRVGIALQVFVDAGYRHVGRCLVAVGRRRHVIETHGVFVFRLLHERTPSEAAPEVVELHGAELVITRPEVCVGRVEQDGVFADGTLIVGRYLLEELQRFVEFPLLEVVERCLVHLLPVVAFQQFVIPLQPAAKSRTAEQTVIFRTGFVMAVMVCRRARYKCAQSYITLTRCKKVYCIFSYFR